jgi:hypothetical protein
MTTNMDNKNIPEEKLTFAKVWEDFTETTSRIICEMRNIYFI